MIVAVVCRLSTAFAAPMTRPDLGGQERFIWSPSSAHVVASVPIGYGDLASD
jgi:hypothetical protein